MKFLAKYTLITVAVLLSPLLFLALPVVILSRFSGRGTKPLIGLVISDRWPAAVQYLVLPYEFALWLAGARTVIFRPQMDNSKLKKLLSEINGMLFTGGEDIAPEFYGETGDSFWPNLKRDEFEFKLLAEADKQELPVLGICRGEQLLAVHYGGKLESHRHRLPILKNHSPRLYWIPTHHINIKPQSRLSIILGNRTGMLVNSLHGYNISDPGKMKITAKSNDRLVEAVELPGGRFVMGVQWHPELTFFADRRTRRLFHAFAKAALTQKAPQSAK